MANKIEIVNLGLSQIKVEPIESLGEGSTQSIHVNRIYDLALEGVLADVSPKWARKQAALALTTDEVSGYDFVYAYPSDCLKDIKIFNPVEVNENDRLEYDIGLHSSGNSKVILSNYEDAELIYTVKVTNTGVYDPLFNIALSLSIASLSVIPLKGDKELAMQIQKSYAMAVNNAKALTKNQGFKKPDNSNSFTDARA